MANDIWGREVGDLDVRAVVSGLKSAVSNVINNQNDQQGQAIERLTAAVEDMSRRLKDNTVQDDKNAQNHVQQVVGAIRGSGKKEEKQSKTGLKSLASDIKASKDALNLIYKASQTHNTFWVGIGKMTNKAAKTLVKEMQSAGCCPTGGRAARAAQRAKEGPTGKRGRLTEHIQLVDDGGKGGGFLSSLINSKIGPGLEKFGSRLGIAADLIQVGLHKLSEAFELDINNVWNGVLINSNRFAENLRQIVYETQGFGRLNRDIEKQFTNIHNSVRASGVAREVFDKHWITNVKRGFQWEAKTHSLYKTRAGILKDQINAQKSVLTTALNTATQFGMAADTVNKVFMDWHLQLGLSANEMSAIARDMRNVSLTTGVTGENLEKALVSADQFNRKMRSAGTFTDESARNVLRMMASAQKYGVEEAITPLMEAMSCANAFENANISTKGFLTRAAASQGLVPELMSGNVMGDRDAMGKMLTGAMGTLSDGLSMVVGRKLNEDELMNLSEVMSKLPEQQQRALQMVVKSQTGMEVGDVERSFRTMKDATKTAAQHLADLDTELAEATVGTDEYNEILQRQAELTTNNYMQAFGSLVDLTGEAGGDINAALAKWEGELTKDFGPELADKVTGNLKESSKQLIQNAQAMADRANVDLEALVKDRGGGSLEQIQAALATGTAQERKDAFARLSEAMQEMAQESKSMEDPITKIRDDLHDIHNWLQDWISKQRTGMNEKLLAFLGWMSAAGPLGLIANLLPTVGGALLKLVAGIGHLTGMIARMVGWAGGKAIGAAKGVWNWGKGLVGGRGAATAGAATGGRTVGAAAGGARGTAAAGGLARGVGVKAGGKLLGPAALALGGASGFMGAEEAGRGKISGTTFGLLTGGAETGSMFSEHLGLKKGSNADKALGMVGSTAYGATAGAAIGAMFGGVGAIPGAIIGGVVGAGAELVKIFTESKLWEDVKDLASMDWAELKNIGAYLFDGLKSKFSDFTSWLGTSFSGLTSSIGSSISSTYAAITDSAKNLFNSITDGIKTALGTLWDWIKKIPGVGGTVKGFGESNKEASARMAKGGASVSHGFGRYVGGAKDVLTGGKEGRWEGVKKQFGGAKEMGKAVLDKVNPLNWFEEGSRQIIKPGVAVLHEGETIIPKGVWDSIKAAGDMPFRSASGAMEQISNLVFGKQKEKGKANTNPLDYTDELFGLNPFQIGPQIVAQAMGGSDEIFKRIKEKAKGKTSTNLLDYSDEMKGGIKPMLFGERHLESAVERRVRGDRPTGTAQSVDMSTITDYLVKDQASLLRQMIEELKAIKQNTTGRQSSHSVGSVTRGLPASSTMGLREISQEYNVGHWDVTFADFSPSSVTTEGRRP